MGGAAQGIDLAGGAFLPHPRVQPGTEILKLPDESIPARGQMPLVARLQGIKPVPDPGGKSAQPTAGHKVAGGDQVLSELQV